MALHAVRSTANSTLFAVCTGRFLGDAAQPGPAGHLAHLWLTHRVQRDAILETAARTGHRGWLNPPIQFLSALPELFGITGRPIGLLARRELISSIGFRHGQHFGIHVGNADASITRGHMLDTFFGELLPEDVTPDALRSALSGLESDEFAARRNQWIIATYTDYITHLAGAGLYDPRAIHAFVARRIDEGALPAAIGGARRLHIYGLYTSRSRGRLLASLARQTDVEVIIYTALSSDIVGFAASVETIDATVPEAIVQPAPDTNRELNWVASEVARLITAGAAEPHEIAVVARSGQEDTRRMLHALERAGVPATARTRTPLAEIAALKALLDLFRGSAEQWSYRVLRNVLASPYLRTRLDLRTFDCIAANARPCSLEEWDAALVALHQKLVSQEHDEHAQRLRLNARRVAHDIRLFRALRAQLEQLDGTKPLGRWLDLTRSILSESWFRFRQRICMVPEARNDVVRIDQRGVRRAEALLAEWASIDDLAQSVSPRDWFRSLRVLFEGQELVLTTPGQKGVQILEAHDAALAPFRAVFMIHANDGEFPPAMSVSGLLSDEERTALRAAGLAIDDRASALARERVLWDAVAGSDRLWISYRTTDPRGTPLLPSLLVPPENHNAELSRAIDVPPPAPEAMRHAIVNAYAEQRRGAPEREAADINPWNGQLRDPAVLAWLTEKFDDDYVWSASQLQTYTKCPFSFLLERVLRVEEVSEAEEDTDALTAGSLAHDILERFYNHYKHAPPRAITDDVRQQLIDISAAVIHERQQEGGWLGLRVLWEQRRLAVLEMLLEFLEKDLENLASRAATVLHCEYEIGGEAKVVEVCGEDAGGNVARMKLRGRIDRVDRNRDGSLTIVDYKSNSTPSGKTGYEDGVVLQAPVYLRALLTEGLPAKRAVYKSLKQVKDAAALTTDDEEYEVALRAAFSVPARARAGLFEAVLAATATWANWDPELAVRRTAAQLEASRFDD